MNVALLDHHGKAGLLAAALENDTRFVGQPPYEAVIADTDSPGGVPAGKYDELCYWQLRGAKIALYQHGAAPQLEYDGIRPSFYRDRHGRGITPLRPDHMFVHGEGHAEIYRRIGLGIPTTVIGWAYSDSLSRVESDQGSGGVTAAPALLFAPLHPWADGRGILPLHKTLNQQAYDQFLTLEGTKTVRMWGEDDPNGIRERHPDIEYTQANLGIPDAVTAVDRADIVVGYGTIAYIAVARGKKVVMYGSDLPPTDDHGKIAAKRWDDYKDYLRYPVDIADGDLVDLVDNYPTEKVAEWSRLFVGEPFNPQVFCDAVHNLRPSRAQRRALARAR